MTIRCDLKEASKLANNWRCNDSTLSKASATHLVKLFFFNYNARLGDVQLLFLSQQCRDLKLGPVHNIISSGPSCIIRTLCVSFGLHRLKPPGGGNCSPQKTTDSPVIASCPLYLMCFGCHGEHNLSARESSQSHLKSAFGCFPAEAVPATCVRE